MEFAVLALLMSKPGRAFTREELLADLWSGSGPRTLRVLDTHVKGIRRKLGECAWVVESVHGVGYRLAGLPQNDP
jgi:DNA-binding response OmpR family regulator